MKKPRRSLIYETAKAELAGTFKPSKPVPFNSILPPPDSISRDDGPGLSEGAVYYRSLPRTLRDS